jgi:D-alanine-D-alanine ligase
VGISTASTADELRAALVEGWRHDPLAIVEALSKGMEVECSVVGNDDPLASEPGELVVNAEWYDYDAKYKPGGMDLVVPARLEDATRTRVRELAVEVFRRVGCAGLARVDFFVEDSSSRSSATSASAVTASRTARSALTPLPSARLPGAP